MNITPHTHRLDISTSYGPFGGLRISYGDQKMNVVTALPGWRGRLERKIKRIVAIHDAASKVAHKNPEAVKDEVAKKHNAILLTVEERYKNYGSSYAKERNVWGSDLLKEIPKQPVAAE